MTVRRFAKYVGFGSLLHRPKKETEIDFILRQLAA